MGAFRLTERARQDLLEIWDHIAAHNQAAADGLMDRLFERFAALAENPLIGPAREDLADGLRYLVYQNYLLLYRLAGDEVVIVRVVHGRRDLFALF